MKSKIYYDLSTSPYKLTKDDFEFVFSSEVNLRKFKDQYEDYIFSQTMKLKNAYSFLNIDFDLFLIVSLYKRIEKRGFILKFNGIDLKENTLFITSFIDDEAVHF